jgi:dihydroorotate dehydrogenase electron transfer subunit
MIEQPADAIFNKRLTPQTFVLGLHAPAIARQAQPGQFVMLKVRAGTTPLLRRPFSICAVQGDLILLLYRLVGEGTRIMTEIKEGQKLPVLGPLGQGFTPPQKDQPAILVAGGVGIAPLIFLAATLGSAPYRFLAGFSTAQEIIPLEKLGFQDLTPLEATDDGSVGYNGFVTGLLEKTLAEIPSAAAPMIYACGPNAMLKKVQAIAGTFQASCEVSLESYMACGLGACQGCAVKTAPDQKKPYLHVCKDGPVFPAQNIDWTAL